MRPRCFISQALSYLFFVKQKTAYERRISDWSSDVCSSDLRRGPQLTLHLTEDFLAAALAFRAKPCGDALALGDHPVFHLVAHAVDVVDAFEDRKSVV